MNTKSLLLLILILILLMGTTQCNPVPVTPDTTVAVQAPSSTLGGKSVVEAKCISCHGMDRIENQSMDAAAWKSTVTRMVNKGAKLTADEQTAVIEYLSITYP